MFSRLLVGLDGSPGADAALTAAIELGRRFRSTILLAAITDLEALEAPFTGGSLAWAEGPLPAPDLSTAASLDARARSLTDNGAERVRAAGLPVEVVHASGLVDEELHNLSQRAEAIVVGRRGQMSVAPGTVGAVTSRIIKRSPKPVVVAGESPSQFQKPAVAFDGGTTSTNALSLAARYAEAARVALDVVTVGDDAAAIDELLARAGAFLSGERVSFTTHRLTGRLTEAVPSHIAASGCDLLVVGAHGGRKKRAWSVGSHAQQLIAATTIPVIVIR